MDVRVGVKYRITWKWMEEAVDGRCEENIDKTPM